MESLIAVYAKEVVNQSMEQVKEVRDYYKHQRESERLLHEVDRLIQASPFHEGNEVLWEVLSRSEAEKRMMAALDLVHKVLQVRFLDPVGT